MYTEMLASPQLFQLHTKIHYRQWKNYLSPAEYRRPHRGYSHRNGTSKKSINQKVITHIRLCSLPNCVGHFSFIIREIFSGFRSPQRQSIVCETSKRYFLNMLTTVSDVIYFIYPTIYCFLNESLINLLSNKIT